MARRPSGCDDRVCPQSRGNREWRLCWPPDSTASRVIGDLTRSPVPPNKRMQPTDRLVTPLADGPWKMFLIRRWPADAPNRSAADALPVRRTRVGGFKGDTMISKALIASNLRTALPCILVGGALGAMVGGVLGSVENGIRVGIILGGAVAFVILRRR